MQQVRNIFFRAATFWQPLQYKNSHYLSPKYWISVHALFVNICSANIRHDCIQAYCSRNWCKFLCISCCM